jgi:hypothetical protein
MRKVRNVHRRAIGSPEQLGALLDGLASDADRLWPGDRWPRMRLDGPLAVGARGGHGPVRYRVERYEPSRHVRFRFERPRGFDGIHEFQVVANRLEDDVIEATELVAARRVSLGAAAVPGRPLLKAFDHVEKPARGRDVLYPVEEVRFGADQLIGLGQICRAPVANYFPRHPGGQGIAGNTRKGIRAAALQGDLEVREGHVFTRGLVDCLEPLLDNGLSLFQIGLKASNQGENTMRHLFQGKPVCLNKIIENRFRHSCRSVIARQMGSALSDALNADYVRAARAAGLLERQVVLRYGVRNALVPVVTVIGLQVPVILGLAFVVEQVFAIPGLGRLAVDAVLDRDIPLLQGVVLASGLIIVLANLVVDASYGWLDPKVRVR